MTQLRSMIIVKKDEISIGEIVTILKEGKTIVYPTETCYGLGGDATNSEAVKMIFKIKERKDTKPVLMIVSDVEMAKNYLEWNDTLEKIASKYWPGALTIVSKIKAGVSLPDGLVGENNEIAVRVSSYSFVASLTKELDYPIVSTSANIAGEPNPYFFQDVLTAFEGKTYQPDAVIDAGNLPNNPPSTIIRVEENNISVIRQGELVVSL